MAEPGYLEARRPATHLKCQAEFQACSVLGHGQTVVNRKQHLGAGEGKALPGAAVPKTEGLETQKQPGPTHQRYPNH